MTSSSRTCNTSDMNNLIWQMLLTCHGSICQSCWSSTSVIWFTLSREYIYIYSVFSRHSGQIPDTNHHHCRFHPSTTSPSGSNKTDRMFLVHLFGVSWVIIIATSHHPAPPVHLVLDRKNYHICHQQDHEKLTRSHPRGSNIDCHQDPCHRWCACHWNMVAYASL